MIPEDVLMVMTSSVPKMSMPPDNRKQSKDHDTRTSTLPVTSFYFLMFYNKQKGEMFGILRNAKSSLPTFQSQFPSLEFSDEVPTITNNHFHSSSPFQTPLV